MKKHLALYTLFASAAAGCGGPNPATMGNLDGGAPLQSALIYTMKSFTLQPGEEKIYCQYVPPDGKEKWINHFTTDMAPGSHHLVVFRINDTQGLPASGPTLCSQLDIPKGLDGLLPGSQSLHNEFSLPDGVAMKMEAYHGLLFQQHYINATTQPITSSVVWKISTVDAATVKTLGGMLFYSNFGLQIPPMQKSVASKTCKAPGTIHLVTTTGHMHKHALSFDATVSGKSVYHTDTWDEPVNNIFPLPGYAVTQGDPITWTCAYNNDTAMTLVFGNSAATNEMCIFVSIFYPSVNGGTEFFCN